MKIKDIQGYKQQLLLLLDMVPAANFFDDRYNKISARLTVVVYLNDEI